MEAFNLATSHTLAFSIGMFCFKDYMYQLERQDKGEEESNTATVTVFNRYQPRVDSKIMMTYCASSFILVIGRIAWQLLSSIYNWNPPQDIQVVAVTSLVLFLCLPSRGLVSYFIPPLITFFMCICSIIWESYMPMHLLQLKYETIVLILTSAIGGASVTACYFISRKGKRYM